MRFAKETWLLALICTLDLLSTALLLVMGRAREANPILRFYVEIGLPAFVCVKILLYAAPLYVLELLRRYRPRFVLNLVRVSIVGYLLIYGLGVLHMNRASLDTGAQAAESRETR